MAPPPYDGFCGHRKWRSHIGEHNIVSKYNAALARSIADALKGCQWVRFYPIRIREASLYVDSNSIVLIIEMEPGASTMIDWAQAIQIALSCRSVLRAVEVFDVEVEMMECEWRPFAASKELDSLVTPTKMMMCGSSFQEQLQPFLSNPGYPIGNSNAIDQGTMGLYVQLGGLDQFFGLTCRHVVDRTHTAGSSAIMQIAHQKFDDFSQQISTKALTFKTKFEKLNTKITHWDEGHATLPGTDLGPKTKREPTRVERSMLPGLKTRAIYSNEIAQIVKELETTDRIIGHTSFTSKYQISNRGYFTDWALVRLDTDARFANVPDNAVFISKRIALAFETESDPETDSSGQDSAISLGEDTDSDIPNGGPNSHSPNLYDTLDNHQRLPITGIVSVPRSGVGRSFGVGKRGAVSGLTFGVTHEILAVVRFPNNKEVLVWQWIVIAEGAHSHRFTTPGDSGSIIWNFNGGIVGMITGGSPHEETNDTPPIATEDQPPLLEVPHQSTDVIFITPAQYLFEDIEETTGRRVTVV